MTIDPVSTVGAYMQRLAQCKASFIGWTQRYVYIEDRDQVSDPESPGIARRFEMWPAQQQVAREFALAMRIIILKARQLGITWEVLAFALWNMLFFPGFSVVALTWREEPEAKELVRRLKFILRNLPKWMIMEAKNAPPGYSGPTWVAQSLKLEITHPGQEPSTFQTMASSPDSGASLTASLLIFDEWALHKSAEALWTSAYPTINRPTGGQFIGLSTGRRGTLFDTVWDKATAGQNEFKAIFLPWWSDPRRTLEWYARTKSDMPNESVAKREYPEIPEDAFAVGEGAGFPEWQRTVHVRFPHEWYPPPNWRLFRSFDPGGFNGRGCCKWYALSPSGIAVGYREFYPTLLTDEQQAQRIAAMSKAPDGSSERIAYTVADTSAWTKHGDTGISTAEIFAKHGVPLTKATKDRVNGWKRLHSWLRPFIHDAEGNPWPRLMFTEACVNTIRTYPALEVDKSDPNDINTHQEDHPQDVDRYFVMSRPAPGQTDQERRQSEQERAAAIEPLQPSTGY